MGGFGGGGKMKMPGSSVEQAAPAPQIQYIQDTSGQDQAVADAKSKTEKALALMRGRSSTILTPDTLGDVAVQKRQLLGG